MAWRSVPRQLLAVAMGSVLLGGCTSAVVQVPTLSEYDDYGEMFPNDDTDREALPSHYYKHPKALNLKKLYVEIDRGLKDGSDPQRSTQLRNMVQNELLRRSDQACSAYQARLIHGYIVGETTVKATTTAFGIVQTLAAPAELLGTAAGSIQGGITTTLNGDILKWQAFQDANKRIHLSRRNLHNVIRKAQAQNAEVYSVSQAIYDAERYHSYCNITTAMVIGEDWVAKEANEQILAVGADNPPPKPASQGTAATNSPEIAQPVGTPKP